MPKLLKNKDDGSGNPDDALRRKEQPERISRIVRDIAKALIIYTKDKKQFKDSFPNYVLKQNQKVRIEDLL